MTEPPERRVKRHRWLGFINGFASGIGFALFFIVIVALAFGNLAQTQSQVGFVVLAVIAGLSIFLLSLTVEVYHQARLGPATPVVTEPLPAGSKICSKCGSEMKFMPKVGKYYCQNCKSYE